MKVLIDVPDEYDVALNLYKMNNNFNTKAEAIVDLCILGLKKYKDAVNNLEKKEEM